MLLFMLLFVLAASSVLLALGRSLYSDLLSYRLFATGAQSYFAADSATEDMAYRFIASLDVDATESLTLGGARATSTYVFDSATDRYVVTGRGELANAFRESSLALYLGVGASFNFGVQSGNGGFTLTNSSSVVGNVFSNGRIEKTGGGTAWIYGDAISAGPSGRIINTRVSGTARANRLEGNYIQGNAYYVTDSASTVLGTRYTPSADEDPVELPISDAEIDTLKQDAEDNGTLIAAGSPECASGTYVISADTTLPSMKVECNLEFQGNNTNIELTGTIWVLGNVTFKSGPNMSVDSAVGGRTVPIIADNPSNRITSSQISVENSTSFVGSGDPKSYVMLISQNNAAELGNNTPVAINLGQSGAGDLLVYAGHGKISLGNSTALNEVTGYLIELNNGATVTYESGLVNLLFTSGPGGGYTLDDWQETF